MDKLISAIPEVSRDKDATVQDYTYQRLRNAIMTGAFAPGHRMTIRGLANDLDISQTPIREAVRRLSSESAIEVLGNRRLWVPLMTLGRFDDLVGLRGSLEVYAALRALPYVSDIEIARMTAIDAELDRLFTEKDTAGLTQMNHEFHRALYVLNPDHSAMPLIESIWLQLGPFQRQVMAVSHEYYSVDRHKEILSALVTRDAGALQTALEADIREGLTLSGRKLLAQDAQFGQT